MGAGALAPVEERRRFLSRGKRAIRFIEAQCVHTQGDFYREPFQLLQWQRDWIMQLFEVDPETRQRRYRWALLGVPKKNGKTELIAALGLYFLLADGEPTPQVVCAATSKEQAGLIHDAAKIMVEESSYSRTGQAGIATLASHVEVSAHTLECAENRGKMYVVAAVDGANDGKNLSAVLIDELHEWTKPKAIATYTVLTGGITSRRQGIIIQITTAGVLDEDALWWREYQRGRAIEEGRLDERDYFFTWYDYAPARDAQGKEAPWDYRDPEVWRVANPSFDHITALEATLRSFVTKRTRGQFLRYHLNIATLSEESWLQDGEWRACRVRSHSMSESAETWVGIDASRKHDSTAVVWGQFLTIDGVQRFLVRAKIWRAPPDPTDPSRRLKSWKIPIAEVEDFTRALTKRLNVVGVGYDPYLFERSAQALEEEGLPMLEFPQHPSRMAPATMGLHTMIREKELAQEGAADFTRQVESAATVTVDSNSEAYRLSKGASGQEIDAAVGLAICARLATQGREEEEVALPGIRTL